MGKARGGGQKQRVADYFLSIHTGICSGPVDAIKRIFIAEKVAWEGNQTVGGTININRPDLFGGPQKEGGVVGNVHYLPGNSDQLLPHTLASRIGGTPSEVPAYRGICSLWFTGAQDGSGGFGFEDWGVQTSYGGFKWSTNSPIIQSVWATVTRKPVGLDPAKALIGDQANPSHIIYECLTNKDWGMGGSTSAINTASFNTVADTLIAEAFGLSMMWTRQTEIENFINEVLDHIQAMLFVNPRDGLLTLKLLRDDYIEAECDVIDPDVATLGNYERKMWGETTNEIAVTWTNPENEQEETITIQDLSNVAIQGAPAQASRNYYGVRTKELAERLAARDLRQTGYPLALCEAKLDRRWWGILPGDVVRLEWPERELTNLFMRVRSVDYGKIGQGEITVSLMEDIFSLGKVRAYVPPGSQAPSVSETPRDIDNTLVLTYPAHWVAQSGLGNASAFDDTESVLGVFAWQNSNDTFGFDLLTEQVNTTGAPVFRNDGQKSLIGLANTTVALPVQVQSIIPSLPGAGGGITPQPGGWVIIGSTEGLHEICLVGPLTETGWTLYRGYLDTVPLSWAPGAPIRYVASPLLTVDTLNTRAVGEVADYKLLSKTSLGVLAESAATVRSGTATNRMHRPLRPGNVTINGTAVGGSVNVSAVTNITLAWATRNRLLQEVSAPLWTAGAETPEYLQRTIVRVREMGGTLIREYNHLWTENGLVLPKAWFAKWASVRVQVMSERDGLESLYFSEFTVNGLANNPAAADPPAAPGVPPAPSPVVAPTDAEWDVVGGFVGDPDGTRFPRIDLVGSTSADVESVLIRYRKVGTTDWLDAGQFDVDQ